MANALFKIKRQITLPVLKMEDSVERYFKFTSDAYIGKEIEGSQMAPATVAQAIDLESGDAGIVVLNTIAVKELTAAYPEGIKGKCFSMLKRSLEGKKYKAMQINEIDDPTLGESLTDADKEAVAAEIAAEAPTRGRRRSA
ncbi:MAG: hypothetical protein ACREUQ_07455 [Burkholderiales bacterium]